MILVLGATGRTGRRVVAGLRDRGVPLRAASRSSSARFDWDDARTWGSVVVDVSVIYLVTPEDPTFSAEQVASFLALARAAGVRRVVLLSGLSAGYGSAPMASRETAVLEAGMEWTILRPGAFQQNFATVGNKGELRVPLGPEPYTAPIAVADIAEAAVAVLTGEGHAGRIYPLAGPRALSYPELLAIVSRETGRTVVYVDEPVERWTERTRAAGVSEAAMNWSLETFEAIRRGEYARLHDGVQRILGRPPREFTVRETSA
ncbi:NAD(P)H-binding protein [Nonomuraea sp. CA-143628]|uniref:NAD(P)H-binding protein n=1 Tax=Nonomuraea sp. CA-143628 TaxID=3239997 RepID=UPI003D93064B